MLPWDRESQAYPGVRYPADLSEVTTAEFVDLSCYVVYVFPVCCQQSAAGPVFKQCISLFCESCILWLSSREKDSFQNAFTGVWGIQGHTRIMLFPLFFSTESKIQYGWDHFWKSFENSNCISAHNNESGIGFKERWNFVEPC